MKFATISQVLPAIVSLATPNVNLSSNESEEYKSKIFNYVIKLANLKNIIMNEEKTNDEMHKYSNDQLAIWGLMKVYSKSQGWYIKTFPNKLKKDNLG